MIPHIWPHLSCFRFSCQSLSVKRNACLPARRKTFYQGICWEAFIIDLWFCLCHKQIRSSYCWQHHSILLFCPCCSCKTILNRHISTYVIVGVCLLNATGAILQVVFKCTGINIPVLVKVLSVAMLLILLPVTNIQLPFHVVVLSLPMLHSLEKITLVPLIVWVPHLSSAIGTTLENFSFVNSPVGKFELIDIFNFLWLIVH